MPNRNGRPVSSPVHNYFKDVDGSKASCQVKMDDGIICGHIVGDAKYPSNLIYYLDKCHNDIAELVKINSQSKPKTADSKSDQQKTLKECFTGRKSYEKNSLEYRERSESVALFVGGSNVPISTVENVLFRKMLSTFDKRYIHFGRKKVTQLVHELTHRLKGKITQLLFEAKRVSITTDLWTKRDLTPFIGVTAHFYNQKDHQRYNLIIGLKELSHRHNGHNIHDKVIEILCAWGIKEKLFKITTDNASNMIKAFQDLSNGNHDMNLIDGAEVSKVNDFDEGDFFNDGIGIDDVAGMKVVDEGDRGRIEFAPSTRVCSDWNLDESFIKENDAEFDSFEEDQRSIWDSKHLRCIIHSLQLVIRDFEKSISSKTIDLMKTLVKHFQQSSLATTALKNLTNGKKLKPHCPTRWMSLYYLIDHLIELRDPVTSVCMEKKIDCLQPSQWENLCQIQQLLEPFAIQTLELQKTKSMTISLVILALHDLENKLEEAIQHGICKIATRLMLANLRKHFKLVLDHTYSEFDPTFVMATALDPRYKNLLKVEEKNVAKKQLIYELNVTNKEPSVASTSDKNSGDGPLSSKRFKTLTMDGVPRQNGNKDVEDEVDAYMNSDFQLDEDKELIDDYWRNCYNYPRLADFAVDLLSIPCSSAASESLFSYAGLLSESLKNHIGNENLENQVLL